eukprot:CAMPEP_0171132508 /NCGR_PEP_ID=MMETSP0766_2-20121228/124692_1 /TAXON_ID=439317 /ORGANISM="Gambierdiscus australes, Strain CAWD 149" /LENGTH=90 /DNA_ID=CAMNT_0011595853 /DNA_START=317 /DNA_END=589 /DNA_ORIENTATION=-
MSKATSGVLLRKPDSSMPVAQRRSTAPRSVVFCPSSPRVRRSTTLERSTARATTKRHPIVISELLLKPAKASAVVTSPKCQTTTNAANMT